MTDILSSCKHIFDRSSVEHDASFSGNMQFMNQDIMEPVLRDEIAARLRALQRVAGATSTQMGSYVGMSRQAWENATRKSGKGINKPPEEAMVRLCEKAHITMEWIYRGDMDNIPHALAILLQEELAKPGSVRKGSVELPGLLEARGAN